MALILTSGLAVSLPLTGAEGLAEEARQLLIRTVGTVNRRNTKELC